ncbi:hypothetical protein AAD001_04805 [Colwelliaceae bacterium 6471]
MKFANILSVLSLITFSSVATFAQAGELVKVEPINNITFVNEVKLDLKHSLQTMKLDVTPVHTQQLAQNLLNVEFDLPSNHKEKSRAKVSVIAE